MVLQVLGSLLGGKGGALKTIAKVVDDLHTSEGEKLDKDFNATYSAETC